MPLIEPNRDTLFELLEKCFQSLYLAVCVCESDSLYTLGNKAVDNAITWVQKLYDLCKDKYPYELQDAYDLVLAAQKDRGTERVDDLKDAHDAIVDINEKLIAEDCLADEGLEHEEYCDMCKLTVDIYNAALLYKQYLKAFDVNTPLEDRVIAEKQALRMARAMKQEKVLPQILCTVFSEGVLNGTLVNPTVQFEGLQEYMIDALTKLNEKNTGREFDLMLVLFMLNEMKGIASFTFDEASELFHISFADGWEKEGKKILYCIEEIKVIEEADSPDVLIDAWPGEAARPTIYSFNFNGESIDFGDMSEEQIAVIDTLIDALQAYRNQQQDEIETETDAAEIEDVEIEEMFEPCEYESENILTDYLLDSVTDCGASPEYESEDNEYEPEDGSPDPWPFIKDALLTAAEHPALREAKNQLEETSDLKNIKYARKIKDIARSKEENWYHFVFKDGSIMVETQDRYGTGSKIWNMLDEVYQSITEDNQPYYFALLDKHQINVLDNAVGEIHEACRPEIEEEQKEESEESPSIIDNQSFEVRWTAKPEDIFKREDGTAQIKFIMDKGYDQDGNVTNMSNITFASCEDQDEYEESPECKDETCGACEECNCNKPERVDGDYSTYAFEELVEIANMQDELIEQQHALIMRQDSEITNLKGIMNSYEELSILLADHDLLVEDEKDKEEEVADPDIQVISGEEYRSLLKESGKVELLKEQIQNLEHDLFYTNKYCDERKQEIESLQDEIIELHSLIEKKETDSNQESAAEGFDMNSIRRRPVTVVLESESDEDPINPDYYKKAGLECFDVMQHYLTDEEMIGFCRGSAFKYYWRSGCKTGNPADQDNQKAKWYLDRLEELENA